jgi:hypothetical protein
MEAFLLKEVSALLESLESPVEKLYFREIRYQG